jgi:hypothetical protein
MPMMNNPPKRSATPVGAAARKAATMAGRANAMAAAKGPAGSGANRGTTPRPGFGGGKPKRPMK